MKSTLFLLATLAPLSTLLEAAPKPNIILIYSDDHGFADLGAQGVDKDIRTPNLDALCKDGVRFSHGYVSAPQCVPSRAGVITGRYQQRFGVEDNTMGPLPLEEVTIAERLKAAGYVSCQVGKWHLEPPPPDKKEGPAKGEKPARDKDPNAFLPLHQGFDEYYTGAMSTFIASHDLKGNKLPKAPERLTDNRFRCVWQADAAISFLDRHAHDPFFLYLAFFAPHVPLDSPEPWYSKTPASLPKERRQALAMIAAMDEGIGRIRAKLREQGNEKNTLIFFIGDNGAPLHEGAWDGSLNLPMIGEKGMLTDGGICTPFVAAWPGTFPAGTTYDKPVINLDVAATAVAIAGLPHDSKLDGVNIVPFVTGQKSGDPHDALYWRWRSQAAIRADHWKYIRVGPEEKYLFDLNAPDGESELAKNNLLSKFPDVAADLEKRLMKWDATLPPPGLPRPLAHAEEMLYDGHVKRIEKTSNTSATPDQPKSTPAAPGASKDWITRNATASIADGALHLVHQADVKAPSLVVFQGLTVEGPATAILSIRSEQAKSLNMAWRLQGQDNFPPEQIINQKIPGSPDFQDVTVAIPTKGKIIQLRVALPGDTFDLRQLEIKPTNGEHPKTFSFGKE